MGKPMTVEEKARKYDEIAKWFWERVYSPNLLVSTQMAAIVRLLDIEGPNGEDSESA